jgi:hypothetical protein
MPARDGDIRVSRYPVGGLAIPPIFGIDEGRPRLRAAEAFRIRLRSERYLDSSS